MSVECRPTCRPSIARHLCRLTWHWTDTRSTLDRYVDRQSGEHRTWSERALFREGSRVVFFIRFFLSEKISVRVCIDKSNHVLIFTRNQCIGWTTNSGRKCLSRHFVNIYGTQKKILKSLTVALVSLYNIPYHLRYVYYAGLMYIQICHCFIL